MKATVGNLRKAIKDLPDSAKIIVEDWDGAYLIKQDFTNSRSCDRHLEGLLKVHDGRLIIVNEHATENKCHKWNI